MTSNPLLLLIMLIKSTHSTSDLVPCAEGMKLFELDDGTYGCLTCIECPAGTIMTKECTDKHDTICKPCYKSGFVGENVTTCSNCSICNPGTFVEKNCSQFGNTLCRQCENGTFTDTFNAGGCKNCSSCEGELKSACNWSQDTVCFYQEQRYVIDVDVILISIDVIVHVILLSTCIHKGLKLSRQKRRDEKNTASQELVAEPTAESNSLETLMSSVGTLILKDKGRVVQTNVVTRVGSKYVMTAYHSLAEYVDIEPKFKLLADEAYVTFDEDPDHQSGTRYKISTSNPAYFNEHFDVLVLDIVQKNILPKLKIPNPINSFYVDQCKDSKLHFINQTIKVNESKWFQVVIAENAVLNIVENLKEKAVVWKINLTDSIEKLYDKCTADATYIDEQWVILKYDKSLRPGSPGFIRDNDGGFKLFCMNTAHFPKLLNALSEIKNDFPDNFLVCSGIKMSAVSEDMKKKNEELTKEIFGS